MPTTSQLVAFILSHGCECSGVTEDGAGLRVASDACGLLGGTLRVYETIPATLDAVREWLGY